MTKPHNPRRQAIRHLWTPEEDQLLRASYEDLPTQDVAEKLGRSLAQVSSRARRLHLKKSQAFLDSERSGRIQRGRTDPRMAATQFQRGHEPWNAGTKGLSGNHPNCRKTQFRKGVICGKAALLVQPIGAERVVGGYLQRKTNNDRPFQGRWKFVHRLVWEAANGPIPPGFAVVFRPGMHSAVAQEITPEKLELVSRADLIRRNTYHNRYPKEICLLIQMRGQLTRRIHRKEKDHEEQA
jgi:hypothetical protein